MFAYRTNYEIDGSDTSYNVMMPSAEKLEEFVRYYMSFSIWDTARGMRFETDCGDLWAPHREEILGRPFDADAVTATVRSADWGAGTCLVTCCLDLEALPDALAREIRSYSAGRPGGDGTPVHVNPSVGYGACHDGYYVGLVFPPPGFPTENAEGETPDGLVLNRGAVEAGRADPDALTIFLTCGPSFIYEYAAYLVTELSKRFPEVGICGGLDCAGGFVEGCTYAANLYAYERFTLQVQGIADGVRNLFESGILRPIRLEKTGRYRYNYRFDRTAFHLMRDMKDLQLDDTFKNPLTPERYAELVDEIAGRNLSLFQVRQASAGLVSMDVQTSTKVKPDWTYTGQIAAYQSGDDRFLDILVPRELRTEFEKRLLAHDIRFS